VYSTYSIYSAYL